MALTLAQKLRDRITLLAPGPSLDDDGNAPVPTVYRTHVAAGIEELSQQDSQPQGQQDFRTTLRTRITIRHDPNVKSTFFAGAETGRKKGQTYTVEQVVDPSIPTRGVFLELWCKLMDDGLSPPVSA